MAASFQRFNIALKEKKILKSKFSKKYLENI